MYEMEGPRPASRRRPADFSASLRRSTTTRARNTPSAPVDRITGWLGGSPRRRLRLSSLPTSPGFPPSRAAPSISSAGGSELSFHQMTGVSPSQKAQVFPSPVAQSFLLRTWLGVSPPPYTLKFSLSPVAQGLLLITWLGVSPPPRKPEVFPAPVAQSFSVITWLGVSPPPRDLKFSLRRVAQGFLLRTWLGASPPPCTLKFSLRRWPEVPPCGFPPCRVAPGFPRDQRPQSLPNTGWPGVSPAPVARSFLLAGGAGLLLALRPGVALCRWLGVSPSPVAVPGGEEISTPIAEAAQGVSGSNFKILSPSTSHPQLTPGCPP